MVAQLDAGTTYTWEVNAISAVGSAITALGGHVAFSDLDVQLTDVSITPQGGVPDLPPAIGTFYANPNPVTAGSEFVLIADNIIDPDGGTIDRVDFYRDSNGNGRLDTGSDQLLGSDTSVTNSAALFRLADFGTGLHRYFATALDDEGDWSAPVTTTASVASLNPLSGNDLSVVGRKWQDPLPLPGGNNNGVPEISEQVELEVKLDNVGTEELYDVEAILTTNVGGVRFTRPQMSWGSIDAGEREWSGTDASMYFTLSNTTSVPFTLHVEYTKGVQRYSQEFMFSETVYAAASPIVAIDHVVWDVAPSSDSNGNGIPESGEYGKFDIFLRNVGIANARNVQARITSISAGNVSDTWHTYQDLNMGGAALPPDDFYWFSVNGIPTNFSGIITADIEVMYDGGSALISAYPLFDVQPLPWASIGPREHDFGVLGTDEDLILPVVIQNNGATPLTVNGITASNPDTTILELPGDPLPWTIAPGSSKQFTVILETSALQGLVNRQVTVSTDGGLTGSDQDILTITGLVSDTPPAFQVPGANPFEWVDTSDNVIVWTESRNGNQNVFAYDLMAGVEHQISSTTHTQNVRIDGNLIAWESYDDLNSQNDIYGYSFTPGDVSNGQQFTVREDLTHQRLVGVDGDKIVFSNKYDVPFVYDLQVYDVGTSITTPVPGFTGGGPLQDADDADFGEGLLTWVQWDLEIAPGQFNNPRLMKYEIGVDPAPVMLRDVSIYGGPAANNGQIAWAERVYDPVEMGDYEQIMLWENGSYQQITSEPIGHGSNGNMALGVDSIIYGKDGTSGLLAWSLTSNQEYAVVLQHAYSESARMDGNLLVWVNSAGLQYTYLETSELAVNGSGISFSDDQPVEGDIIDVTITVSNVNLWPTTQTASIQLYDGDPDNGGDPWGAAMLISTPIAPRSETTVMFTGLLVGPEGTHNIYAVITTAEIEYPANNSASKMLIVQDSDTEGPAITGITIQEHNGDGDGIIGDDEQVRLTWTLTDPSGVDPSSVMLLIDGSPVVVNDEGSGNYSSILSALSVPDTHSYQIQAYDMDLSPESASISGSFEVVASESITVQYNGVSVTPGGAVNLGEYPEDVAVPGIPILVRNDGEQTLTITGLDVSWTSGSGTHTAIASLVLAPGEFTFFSLSPDTSSLGAFGADVTITNSDIDLSPLTFSIVGEVVPVLTGDLNGDGFVGIADLNLILSNWNMFVPPGDTRADVGGVGGTGPDGYIGIDDLNTVLGNWNAGTPPAAPEKAGADAAMSILPVASESESDSLTIAVVATEAPIVSSDSKLQARRSRHRRQVAPDSVSEPAKPTRQFGSGMEPDVRIAMASWQHRDGRLAHGHSERTGYVPRALQTEDEALPLGLWE